MLVPTIELVFETVTSTTLLSLVVFFFFFVSLLNSLSPMAGKSPGPFPTCDWRFNEFPNPAAHALHVTCVELMALAVPGKDVGNALLNVVLKRYDQTKTASRQYVFLVAERKH